MEISAFLPQEMRVLLEVNAPLYLSMYLPIDTATLKAKKTRAANLLRQAQAHLQTFGWDGDNADMLLAPMRECIEEEEFWRGRRGTLVLFRTPDWFRVYHVPLSIPERVVVGHSFFVRPLLPLSAWTRPFYVLAASQHRVRVLDCTFEHAVEMNVEGMPLNLDDALKDEEVETEHRVRTTPPTVGTGRFNLIGYGEGGQEEREKRVERYLRLIDTAVRRALNGAHVPLVFAGVEHLFPVYQSLTSYPELVPTPLKGSPDRMSVATLHKRAAALLQGYMDKPKCDALATYQALEGTQRIMSDPESILNAAQQGRVETLLIYPDTEGWGAYDAGTGQMMLHPTAQNEGTEMSNLAAILTLRNKGTAFVLDAQEMPTPTAMAAILRY